jgi:hypothetical protein
MKKIFLFLGVLIPQIIYSQAKVLKGDFDGDGKIEFMRNALQHGYYHVLLTNNKEIPPLVVDASHDVQFFYVGDLNKNKSDEVFVFLRSEIGYHGRIKVFSLIRGVWREIRQKDWVLDSEIGEIIRGIDKFRVKR